MANLLNSILNSLGIYSKQAEKSFFRSRVDFLGLKQAAYIDTDVPYRLWSEIPELNQVVNKKATMMSNGIFKLRDAKTRENIEDKALFDLLSQPNIFQSQNDWIRNYQQQLDIYGNQFIYANKPTSLTKYPKSLINISPAYIEPVLTGKLFDQTDMSGVISRFDYKENGKVVRSFEVKDIIWSKHSDLDNPVIGCSPLKSLRFPLTNTKLAYDYLNIISGEKGAIGMVSSKSKDSFGAIPMTPERRKDIANQISQEYGVGDDKLARISIVDGDTTWTPMSYPTKDLLLLEQIDANKLTICDHLGLNINIFSSKAATYENVKFGIQQSYNDAVIPAADSMCQKLQSHLNIDKRYQLYLDYSHISILQPDKGLEADILTKQLNSVKEAVASGILSPEQAKAIYKNSFGLEF